MYVNLVPAASLLLAMTNVMPLVSAQFVVSESLSFGQDGKINLVDNSIPGWNLFGEGHAPQMLSDRVILTPPAPGNTRGALWSVTSPDKQHWLADVAFRASGSDRGSGNFQIWFVKDGHSTVSSKDIYTVGKFQGLGLVVDQYGGHGGMLRGFLNDGSVDFKSKNEADLNGLAFGHCNFAYRNLGIPSRIAIINDVHGFKVNIDDQPCFSSEKISLPVGYRFGMSASTAEHADSFEVNKFAISLATHESDVAPHSAEQQQQHTQQQQHYAQQSEQQQQQQKPLQGRGSEPHTRHLENLLDSQATLIMKLQQNIEALLDKSTKYHDDVQVEFSALNKRIAELSTVVTPLGPQMGSLKGEVGGIRQDVGKLDVAKDIQGLHRSIDNIRGGIADTLPDTLHQIVTGSAPKMGFIILIFVAIQATLFGSYLLYKKRRDSAPKKFL